VPRRNTQGNSEGAVDQALAVVRLGGSGWREGAGVQLCRQVLDALGPDSPVAKKGRRRLANYLFN
jgi:thioredoxin-like negative regulator of GroEL